jgi:hypothetical protein
MLATALGHINDGKLKDDKPEIRIPHFFEIIK